MENQQGTSKSPKCICIYREKGKPSSKPPFLGAMSIFQGVQTAEAESYIGTPTRKTSSIWKILEFFYLKKKIGQMATWMRIAMDGT